MAHDEVPRGSILPAPACDLIDRLTKQFDVPFSLTDLHGAVVASTADLVAGHVDPVAARVAQESAFDHQGGEAVYVPINLSGKTAGVLIAHAPDEEVQNLAHVAAITIGLALDFAEAASTLGRDNVNPGLLLYRLLRGTREEASRARIVAAVYGWNLFRQRVALVVLATSALRQVDRTRGDPRTALKDVLGSESKDTPFGQVSETQWVMLPEYEARDAWSRLNGLAESIRVAFDGIGIENSVGIGYPHLPFNPVQAVRWSYREAVFAARIGRRSRGPGIYDLRSLGSVAFFAPSASSRRRLAGLVLDPLEKHPNVLETLQTFLAANMSVADAAEQLNMHRHTVRNHLERVRELTGLDPRVLEDAVQLKLALITHASAEKDRR